MKRFKPSRRPRFREWLGSERGWSRQRTGRWMKFKPDYRQGPRFIRWMWFRKMYGAGIGVERV